jgi:TRAP-type mannitol/chloroaromatic compound transport system permease small subunit
MILVSFVLQLWPREAGESWAPRLQRLLLPVDRVSTIVGQFFAWSILLLTLAVSYEVFSRYVLGAPTDWAFDASYILYGILFIMAGAYALARNAHVRGDFLYRAWSPKRQAGMDLALYFLFFFPGIIAFIYSGYGFAAQSWFSHEHSAYSPAGPPIYHYKTIIPVTGILLLLQGIVEVIRCLICLKTGGWPQRLHDVEELEKVILEQHDAREANS